MLARHAAALRERLELAADELDDVMHLRAGRLRLAAFPSAGSVLVPPAIAAFRAAHPAVELSLDEAEPAAAADGLRDGRFDLAIVFEYDFEPVLDAAGIVLAPAAATTRCSSRCRRATRWPARTRIPMGEPARRDVGLERRPDVQPAARRTAPAGPGFTPRVAFASDDYGAVGRLVLAGVGVALVPELAAPSVGDAVLLRRLEPAPARDDQRRGRRRVRSPAADAMLALLTTASDRSTSSAPAAASA